MKTKEQLARDLETKEGWKSILGGWFKGYRANKKCEEYKKAELKGVADFVMLRKETYDDYYYGVGAFSISNELTEEQIKLLKERIEQFPINQIRYESFGTGGFYQIVNENGEYYQEDYVIHGQAEDLKDVYVTALSHSNREAINCPYVVYKQQSGAFYVTFVDHKSL